MAAALIPIVVGKITERLAQKSKDKLSDLDIKSKANDFLKKKLDKIPAFNEEKKALKKKQSLERDLKSSLDDLNNAKDKGDDYDSLSKKLEKVKNLEESIEEIESSIRGRVREQERLQKEIESRLNAKIDSSLESTSEIRPAKKVKTIKSEKAPEKIQEPPSFTNEFKQTTSLFKNKKPRNIKETLGRPKGSKNKPKDSSLELESSQPKKPLSKKSSFLGSISSSPLSASSFEDTSDISTKELKLMDLLVLNNNLQLEELEKLNQGIEKLSGSIESSNSRGLLDLVKNPKNILKNLAKSPVTKAIGVGAGIAAGVATVGYEVISPQLDQRSFKKQLDEQLASGQITKEEYDKQLSFSKSKNDGKSKGAATGAAIGLGIGALTGPFAPVAMPALSGLGAFAGNYLGGKRGENNAMEDYLKTTAYLESGFNPNAKAQTSSASGMFQFTKGTWESMNKKHGLGYSLEDRFDPQKSAQMAALFASENKQIIEKGTNQKATGTDMYMGHFLGAQGAVNFLNTKKEKGEEKAALDPRFKSAASANKSIFYNKDGTPKSFNEVYELMDTKYKKGQVKAEEIISKNIPQVLPPANVDSASKDSVLKKESSSGTTTVETKSDLSEGEKKELIRQQNLKRYRGTSYAGALSIQDNGLSKSLDSKIINYDKSKEKMESRKMQESSKILSSEISKASPSQPSVIVQSGTSSPQIQNVADDYISQSIRFYVNN